MTAIQIHFGILFVVPFLVVLSLPASTNIIYLEHKMFSDLPRLLHFSRVANGNDFFLIIETVMILPRHSLNFATEFCVVNNDENSKE